MQRVADSHKAILPQKTKKKLQILKINTDYSNCLCHWLIGNTLKQRSVRLFKWSISICQKASLCIMFLLALAYINTFVNAKVHFYHVQVSTAANLELFCFFRFI